MFALRKLHFSSSTFGWGSWGVSTTNLGDSMIEGATCFPATIGFGTGLQIYIWQKHFIPPPSSTGLNEHCYLPPDYETSTLSASSLCSIALQAGQVQGHGEGCAQLMKEKPRGSLRSNQAGIYWLTAEAGASRAKPPTTKNEEGWLPLLKMNTHFLRSILVNRQRIKFWENKLLHEVLTKAWAKTSDDWRTRESKHSVMCDCLLSSITWQLPAIG